MKCKHGGELGCCDKCDNHKKLEKAIELLTECSEGFSAFIMGRRMSRKKRDALRLKIDEFIDGV